MHEAARKFIKRPAGVVAGLFVVGLVFVAVITKIVHIGAEAFGPDVMAPPSLIHLLGTDDLGRSVLRNLLEGTRVSIVVGLSAAVAALVAGTLLGALSGFYGGRVDAAIMRLTELFQVMPTFIMAALIVAMAGPSVTGVIVVISLLAWPQVARLMRGEVIRVREREFVDAARCLGFRERTILAFEIVPNAIAPVLAVSTLIIGQAILLEASLSFLGLASPDAISWGRMLNNGQRFLFNGWWLSVFPGLAIFLTVLAFNLLGDAIGSALDPKSGR
jgi:peptide/nickel transport system permease protein